MVRLDHELGNVNFLTHHCVNFITKGLNGFLGLSLNDGTLLFLVILLDKTVLVGLERTVASKQKYEVGKGPSKG